VPLGSQAKRVPGGISIDGRLYAFPDVVDMVLAKELGHFEDGSFYDGDRIWGPFWQCFREDELSPETAHKVFLVLMGAKRFMTFDRVRTWRTSEGNIRVDVNWIMLHLLQQPELRDKFLPADQQAIRRHIASQVHRLETLLETGQALTEGVDLSDVLRYLDELLFVAPDLGDAIRNYGGRLYNYLNGREHVHWINHGLDPDDRSRYMSGYTKRVEYAVRLMTAGK
jgi:hypothetical protein